MVAPLMRHVPSVLRRQATQISHDSLVSNAFQSRTRPKAVEIVPNAGRFFYRLIGVKKPGDRALGRAMAFLESALIWFTPRHIYLSWHKVRSSAIDAARSRGIRGIRWAGLLGAISGFAVTVAFGGTNVGSAQPFIVPLSFALISSALYHLWHQETHPWALLSLAQESSFESLAARPQIYQNILYREILDGSNSPDWRIRGGAAAALNPLCQWLLDVDPSGQLILSTAYPLFQRALEDPNYSSAQNEAAKALSNLARATLRSSEDVTTLREKWEPLLRLALASKTQDTAAVAVDALDELRIQLWDSKVGRESGQVYWGTLFEDVAKNDDLKKRLLERLAIPVVKSADLGLPARPLLDETWARIKPGLLDLEQTDIGANAVVLEAIAETAFHMRLSADDPLVRDLLTTFETVLQARPKTYHTELLIHLGGLLKLLAVADPTGRLLTTRGIPLLESAIKARSYFGYAEASVALAGLGAAISYLQVGNSDLEDYFWKSLKDLRSVKGDPVVADVVGLAVNRYAMGLLAQDPTGELFLKKGLSALDNSLERGGDEAKEAAGIFLELFDVLLSKPELRHRLFPDVKRLYLKANQPKDYHVAGSSSAGFGRFAQLLIAEDPSLESLKTEWVPLCKEMFEASNDIPRRAGESLATLAEELGRRRIFSDDAVNLLLGLYHDALYGETHGGSMTAAAESLGALASYLRLKDPTGILIAREWMHLYLRARHELGHDRSAAALSGLPKGALLPDSSMFEGDSVLLTADQWFQHQLVRDEPLVAMHLATLAMSPSAAHEEPASRWRLVVNILRELSIDDSHPLASEDAKHLIRAALQRLRMEGGHLDAAMARELYRHYFGVHEMPAGTADAETLLSFILLDAQIRQRGIAPAYVTALRSMTEPSDAATLQSTTELLNENQKEVVNLLERMTDWANPTDPYARKTLNIEALKTAARQNPASLQVLLDHEYIPDADYLLRLDDRQIELGVFHFIYPPPGYKLAKAERVANVPTQRRLWLAANIPGIFSDRDDATPPPSIYWSAVRHHLDWIAHHYPRLYTSGAWYHVIAGRIREFGPGRWSWNHAPDKAAYALQEASFINSICPLFEKARALGKSPARDLINEIQKSLTWRRFVRNWDNREYEASVQNVETWFSNPKFIDRLAATSADRVTRIRNWIFGTNEEGFQNTNGLSDYFDAIQALIELPVEDSFIEELFTKINGVHTDVMRQLGSLEVRQGIHQFAEHYGAKVAEAMLRYGVLGNRASVSLVKEYIAPTFVAELETKIDAVYSSQHRELFISNPDSSAFQLFERPAPELKTAFDVLRQLLGPEEVLNQLVQRRFERLNLWIALLNYKSDLLPEIQRQLAVCPKAQRAGYLDALVEWQTVSSLESVLALTDKEIVVWQENPRVLLELSKMVGDIFALYKVEGENGPAQAKAFVLFVLRAGRRSYTKNLEVFFEGLRDASRAQNAKAMRLDAARFLSATMAGSQSSAAISRRFQLMTIVGELLQIYAGIHKITEVSRFAKAIAAGVPALLRAGQVDVARAGDFKKMILKGLLKQVTGVSKWQAALDQSPWAFERTMLLVTLYFRLADHSAGSTDERNRMREYLSRMLGKFLETGSGDALRETILNLPENKAEIDRLVAAGYDRALFEQGLEYTTVVSGLNAEQRRLQAVRTIHMLSQELVEVAEQVAFLPHGMTPIQLADTRFDSHEAAEKFVKEMAMHAKGKPEMARAFEVLDHIKQAEAEASRPMVNSGNAEQIRIVISKDFLEEASAGAGNWAGCFNVNGIHREMPVAHGMEGNAMFARAYNASGQMIANIVLAFTDQGVVVFAPYSSRPDLYLDDAWLEVWKRLALLSPGVILPPTAAGGISASQHVNSFVAERSIENAVKRATVWGAMYYDFGRSENDGNTVFSFPKAWVVTRAGLPTLEIQHAHAAARAEEQSAAAAAPTKSQATVQPQQKIYRLEKLLIQQSLFALKLDVELGPVLSALSSIIFSDTEAQLDERLAQLTTRGKNPSPASAQTIAALKSRLEDYRRLYQAARRRNEFRIRQGVTLFVQGLDAWRKKLKRTPTLPEVYQQFRETLGDGMGVDFSMPNPETPIRSTNARRLSLSSNETAILDFEISAITQKLAEAHSSVQAQPTDEFFDEYDPPASDLLLHGRLRIQQGAVSLELVPVLEQVPDTTNPHDDTLQFELYVKGNELYVELFELDAAEASHRLKLYHGFEALTQFLSNELNRKVIALGDNFGLRDLVGPGHGLEELGWLNVHPAKSLIRDLWLAEVAPALQARGMPAPEIRRYDEQHDHSAHFQKDFEPTLLQHDSELTLFGVGHFAGLRKQNYEAGGAYVNLDMAHWFKGTHLEGGVIEAVWQTLLGMVFFVTPLHEFAHAPRNMSFRQTVLGGQAHVTVPFAMLRGPLANLVFGMGALISAQSLIAAHLSMSGLIVGIYALLHLTAALTSFSDFKSYRHAIELKKAA